MNLFVHIFESVILSPGFDRLAERGAAEALSSTKFQPFMGFLMEA
jgi:hypothetical protein